MSDNNTERNPNHPVSQTLHESWHKIAAALVAKFGGDAREVVITINDLQLLNTLATLGGINVVAQELDDGLHLRLVSDAEGERLVKREGGLPT